MSFEVKRTSSISCSKCYHPMIEEDTMYACSNCGNSVSASVVDAILRQGQGPSDGAVHKQGKLSFRFLGPHRVEGAPLTPAPEATSSSQANASTAVQTLNPEATFQHDGFLPLLILGVILLLTTNLLVHSRQVFAATVVSTPFELYGLFISLGYVRVTGLSLVLGTRFTPLRVVVSKADLVSCQSYRFTISADRLIINSLWFVTRQWDRPGSRSFHPGVGISAYGWGRQRQELFRALAAWLSDAPVTIDEQTRQFIENASG